MSRSGRFLCLAVLWTFCLLATRPGACGSLGELAARIFKQSGVRGGVVVQLGLESGELTAALHASEAFLVQGLDRDPEVVQRAGRYIRSRGLYGPVTVRLLRSRRLPYVDNFVNLIVLRRDLGVDKGELLRVLKPGGVLLSGKDKVVKPFPSGMDDWTHYLHDSTNNAVSKDKYVGPPRHLKWIGSPRYSRHHDHMSSASAMVAAGGRVFAIFDHGPTQSILLPPEWLLVARDAFNGTVLWKRRIPSWFPTMFRLKSGPTVLTRRLVATADRVYVTLGLYAPVSALDPATGRTLKVYDSTEGAEEILYRDGVLYLVVRDKPPVVHLLPVSQDYVTPIGARRVLAVGARSGEILWEKKASKVIPVTLTVDDSRVYFQDGDRIVCLNRETGRELWRSMPLEHRRLIPTFFAPTVVAYRDVVLYSGGSDRPGERDRGGGVNTMYALSAKDGSILWRGVHPPSGYKSPEDILVAQGLVWTPATTIGADSGEVIGRDPLTGKVRVRFLPDIRTHWFHHRCYRAKATESYLLTSRTGIEFVDLKAKHWICNHWVRGACLYGTMPAYGMVFNPPHPCACYSEAKLFGFNALESGALRDQRALKCAVPRLIKGPAYDSPLGPASTPADWPTYRHDPARSGATAVALAPNVALAWKVKLGGRLSSPVVSNGKIFVASVNEHTLYVLDARTGNRLWDFTADGRIDSPPTVWRSRVYFGCTDGWVYCLRASDGALVWRFRAAPAELQHGAFEQLECVWPVHGSVLFVGKELWCVAGRSMFVDGGLRLIRLDPVTGKLIEEKVMDERDPATGENLQTRLKGLNMPVALPDILSYDGKYVYMRSQRFDLEGNRLEIEIPTFPVTKQRGEGAHLFSPTGFLDDLWWHRSYWIYGRIFKSGAGGYYQAGRVVPAGKPLVFNRDTVFGYGRLPRYYRWTTPMEYQLFATAKQPEVLRGLRERAGKKKRAASQPRRRRQPPAKRRGGLRRPPATRIAYSWTKKVPILVRALVLCGDTLFLAGPPDLVDEEQAVRTFAQEDTQKLLARQARAYRGAEGGLLWAVSARDGAKLSECKLEEIPVFDGLIAAGGRLYMITTEGSCICFEPR